MVGAVVGDLGAQRGRRLGLGDRDAARRELGAQTRRRRLELQQRAERVEEDRLELQATQCQVVKSALHAAKPTANTPSTATRRHPGPRASHSPSQRKSG